MYFGTFIKKQRIIMDKSQKDMASYLGIRRQSISKWENNLSFPSIEHLYELSEFLEIPIDELLKHLKDSKKKKKGESLWH